MRASLLASTLAVYARQGLNVLVEGPPGVGKTQVTRQVARGLDGWGFRQLHAPTMQPEDLGLPVFSEDKRTHSFTVPYWFPLAGAANVPDHGIILIDEIAQADNPIQKTLANLMQERELNGHQLQPGWCFVTTGNRKQDRAGANRILSHLSDRMVRLEFEPSVDDWVAWAMTEGNVDPLIIGYIRFRPDALLDFDANRDINATPRGWSEKVNRTVGKVANDAEFEAIKGCVGEGRAAEFVGFMSMYRKLPTPESILSNPTGAEVPTENNIRYATAAMIAAHANHQNIDAVMTYVQRMPPEFIVLVVRDMSAKDPTLQETKPFIQWAQGPGASILM